ncbi:hypothetical protein BCR44DRAFT_1009777 [Catenaria anguillulae PL171]|uniref:Uncharacterized protein n=1 Tax=Catenaria anguillulae PL171 TaxID=765915 RepID=A0A1Y2I3X8_9FUNG|nr:hypothetical protein BCR44DRAFT_1009777 [Catenaria anguillulae PL171]
MQPHTRPTLRSPTRQASASGAGGTWWASDRLECSKFFVGCLVECWLGQEPYGPARQEQIKILGKDVLNALYYVVDHISVEALLDVLKAGVPAQVLGLSRWAEAETGEVGLGRIALRAAYHHIAPPLYRFLYSALSHHPLIDSDHGCYAMRQVLSIWIRWITPLAATSPSFSDADLHLVDAFVLSNFAFYTTLMHTYLLRALDLLPLARPQANTRKPGAGYADDMQGIAQVLMVYAAAGQDKQSGPTVYHASVIQLEHVMLGGANGSGSGSGDARAASMASTRATVESHMAWLEGAPASSAGVARVRSRWRPVLVDVDLRRVPGTMPSGPLASADTPAAAAVGWASSGTSWQRPCSACTRARPS